MAYPYNDLQTVTTSTKCDPDWANDNVVTPLNDLKAELGNNPRGSAASVEARLDLEHNDDGTHSGAIVLAVSDIPDLTAYLKVDGTDVMEGNLDLSSYYLTGMSYEVRIGYNRLVGASYKVQLGKEDCAPVVAAVTTAQRDALSACNGMIIYNTTTDQFEVYENGSWQSITGSSNTGEIFLTAAGGWPSTTSGCATPTKVEFTTNNVDLYLADFDAATDEYMQWTVVMPYDWDGGTVTAKFYWLANDATTDSVVWGIQGRAYGDGESVDQAWGTAQTVTDANGGTANQLRISAATPAVTLAGTPAAGELVQFRAFRDADNASDTLAADARLVGVLITYTRSS